MSTAVYLRMSLDRTGEALGIERQRQDLLALVNGRGGTVGQEFVDNSVSASSGRRRPAYEAMLAAVERGEVDTIAAWSLDRLVRRMADLERLVELCDRHHVTILLARGSDLDLSTPGGRLVAGLLGTVARHEVDVKADRQRREARQRAERGLPPGGRRAFGYRGVDLVESEAAAGRDAYAQLLAGGTLSKIARDLNAAGHLTTVGGQWTVNSARSFLLNPRNAGQRYHLGQYAGPAAWPALVDETTYEAVRAMLTDPDRNVSRSNALRWLGTGLYECGRCPGQTVICTYRGIKARGTQRRVYRCPSCYMTRVADPIDKWVVAFVAELLSRSDRLAERLARREGGQDPGALSMEARGIRVRLDALADNLDIDEADLARRSRKLRERLAQIQQELAEAGRGSAAGALAATGDPRAAWLALDDIGRRQAVVRDLCTVRLLPMGPGRKPFDPESVDIT